MARLTLDGAASERARSEQDSMADAADDRASRIEIGYRCHPAVRLISPTESAGNPPTGLLAVRCREANQRAVAVVGTQMREMCGTSLISRLRGVLRTVISGRVGHRHSPPSSTRIHHRAPRRHPQWATTHAAPRSGEQRCSRAKAGFLTRQQMRGSCSPLSMSTTRLPPILLRRNTLPG